MTIKRKHCDPKILGVSDLDHKINDLLSSQSDEPEQVISIFQLHNCITNNLRVKVGEVFPLTIEGELQSSQLGVLGSG